MKKLSVLLLTAILLLCFTACSGAPNEGYYGWQLGDNAGLQQEVDNKDAMLSSGDKTFVENPYVSAEGNGISTISADVDTVSYSLFRKLVGSGVPASSMSDRYYYFHTEEMINYFHYDYRLPENDELFGVTATVSECPWNSASKLLVLGM